MLNKTPAAKEVVNVILPQPNGEKPKETIVSKEELVYRCKNCNNVISGPNAESLYHKHLKTCVDTNNFECSICFKKFVNKRGLNNHLRTTHLVFY